MTDDFSMDDLIVEDEEVPNPVIMPVTVLVCQTDYEEQVPVEILSGVVRRLGEDFGFRRLRKRHREGFFDFDLSEDGVRCMYARETPIRIDFEKGDLRITTRRLRAITPSYRVMVAIQTTGTTARVTLFGGDDKITARALGLINQCIRGCVRGSFRSYETEFTKEEMYAILSHFGLDVQYVYLSPGESERLKKIAKRKIEGEIREIPLYIVHAKFVGYRVMASPLVVELIKEGKISVRQIEGKITLGGAISITARVSSTGRITYFIPEHVIGKNQTAYDVAEELYSKMVSQRSGKKQLSMEEFFPGSA